MTVESAKQITYILGSGNGVATAFDLPFNIDTTSELVVGFKDSNDNITLQTSNQYSLENNNQRIRFTTAPPARTTVFAYPNYPLKQETNFNNLASIDPQTLGVLYDKITDSLRDLELRSQQAISLHPSIASSSLYGNMKLKSCLLYTSPSPRDRQKSRMPSSA